MKSKILRAVVLTTALTLNPFVSAMPSAASPQDVQQASQVSGTVVDDQGEPIIGATVLVVGASTSQGTVTDFDGNFRVHVKPGAQLKISYVGYVTQTLVAKNGMKVILKSDAVNLGAVEVVAYGVQKKVTVTGALSSIKGEDLVRTPVSSVNNVLGGQLSGVTTVQYSGEPGSDAASVFVRGQATFNGSSPLIQVDGVERDMYDIDPEEIESITVLKDASATAVFGVRGANGVVLITTKRGAEGKAKIDVSTSWSVLAPTKMVEQASSYDYAMYYNQMDDNDGLPHQFSDAVLQKFKDGSDPIRFPSTKWDEYIMKDATLQTKHNVNISGGTKSVRYFLNIGYYTQGGLFKEFGQDYKFGYEYNRFNYRANIDMDVTKTTTISFNLAGNVSNANKPYTGQGSSGMVKALYQATPFSSPGIIDGKYISTATDYDDIQLPFVGGSGITYFGNSSVTGGFMQTNINKTQMDLQLNQKLDMITKGLSFKIKGSYNSSYTIYKNGAVTKATYTPVLQGDGTIAYRKYGDEGPISYSESYGKARNWYFESSLNYHRAFGKHTVGGLLLYNQSKEYYPGTYSDIPHGYVGLVGRATYDYDNKYMLEFNVGYNGSENFAPGKRYGTFPAVSVGWVVSEEKFWEPLKNVVNFLKLRASYGLVGNDVIGGSRFMYTADPYVIDSNGLISRGYRGYSFGNSTTSAALWKGAYESARNNPDLTWEHAYKQDYGFDANFLNDRLRTTFDYYYEHRTDILLTDYTAPDYIGYTLPLVNAGIVNSHGWELSLKWNDKIGKNMRYWIETNLSYNQNKVIERKEAPVKNSYMASKGHRLGSRSLYKLFGFYSEKTNEEYRAKYGVDMPIQLAGDNLKYGDCVYVDLDGDGKIDSNDMSRELGYTDDPEYMAGINIGFKWKNLSVNTQWTAAWNVSRLIEDVFRQPFVSASSTTQGGLLQYLVDHTWTADNPDFKAKYPRATWANANNNYASSTLYDQDSKYLRLKTLQIAYDMHFPWMKAIGAKNIQVALSGYNLLTFTPYLWGDPEVRASSSPTYPLQRTYTISLKVGF
ncbi:MAG TPA: SusC/RagA family TonB-linked outer membrane protein [Prevotella sp.]|nr:SusC/RagA family TonB-linked outer membrane protein [Prevotella sp.]